MPIFKPIEENEAKGKVKEIYEDISHAKDRTQLAEAVYGEFEDMKKNGYKHVSKLPHKNDLEGGSLGSFWEGLRNVIQAAHKYVIKPTKDFFNSTIGKTLYEGAKWTVR